MNDDDRKVEALRLSLAACPQADPKDVVAVANVFLEFLRPRRAK